MNRDHVKKNEILEIGLVRSFALLGVLAVHATSFATLQMIEYNSYWLINFLNIFMKFGTPTFIFLSSFVLFYNYYCRPVSKTLILSFFQKRGLFIILPYIFFSIIYYSILLVTHYNNETIMYILKDFSIKLLTGNAYTHLYFIFISVQFYLLFPFVLLLFKRFPKVINYSILIGLAVQCGFRSLNIITDIPYESSWFLSYFSYYMLGAFIGINYSKVKPWLTLNRETLSLARQGTALVVWIVWLVSGITNVYVWYTFRTIEAQYPLLVYESLWGIYTFTSALVLLQLAIAINDYLPIKGSNLLQRLGQLSFGIYLVHPLFLALYREFPPNTNVELLLNLWYLGGFFLALFGSWFTVSIVSKFMPNSWLFIGKVNQQSYTASLRSNSKTVNNLEVKV